MSASNVVICTATAVTVFIMAISCIQLTTRFLLHLRGENGIRSQMWSSIASWISNVGFTLTAILILAQMICIFIMHGKSPMFQIMVGISAALYLLSETLMILTFTFRIDLTFKHSAFAYSACKMKTMYMCVSILVCLFALAMIAWCARLNTALLLIGVIWSLLYCGLCITLMVLFTRKMDQVIIEYMRNMERSETSSSETVAVDVLIDEELLYIVIKHGILVPLAIVSSFVTFIITLYMQYASGWTFVSAFLFAFDSFVSGTCIFLLFSFNHRVYDVVCGPLHRLCKRCKVWQMKSKYTVNESTMAGNPSLECVETNSNPSVLAKSKPATTSTDQETHIV